MPYRVTVDHPNAGDTDVYIHGLGTFHNGTTYDVSDEDIERFRIMNSIVNVSNPDKNGNRKHVPALAKHPVDLQIFGVRVERVDDDSSTGEEGSE